MKVAFINNKKLEEQEEINALSERIKQGLRVIDERNAKKILLQTSSKAIVKNIKTA